MTRNNILLIVSLVIVLGGGVYYFLFYTNNDPVLVSDSPLASDAELSFISLVSKLDPITFDTALLSDPRFTGRTDIRTTILPETAGRVDPFAPISGSR